MTGWIDRLRENETRPLVARLTFLDQLEPQAHLTAEVAFDQLFENGEDLGLDANFLARGIARLMPQQHWIPFIRRVGEEAYFSYLSELLPAELDHRLLPAIGPALAGRDAATALRLFGDLFERSNAYPEIETLWRAVEARIDDADPAVADLATTVTTRARRSTPTLVPSLARMLAATKDADADSYDEQVSVEDLLRHVAHAGPMLQGLAPSLVPLLEGRAPAWRAGAMLAAIGIDARSLREMFTAPPAAADDLSGIIDGIMASYGQWVFGGAEEHLARALTLVGDNVVFTSRLEHAISVSRKDPRLLEALRNMARDASSRAMALRALGSTGPAAKEVVATLPELPLEDEDSYWDVEMRWQCGVLSAEETRVRLERRLAGKDWLWDSHGWSLFVKLAEHDEAALRFLRTELSAPTSEHASSIVGPLASAPTVARHLLPELLRGDYEETVFMVRRTLDDATFRAALSEARGRDQK